MDELNFTISLRKIFFLVLLVLKKREKDGGGLEIEFRSLCSSFRKVFLFNLIFSTGILRVRFRLVKLPSQKRYVHTLLGIYQLEEVRETSSIKCDYNNIVYKKNPIRIYITTFFAEFFQPISHVIKLVFYAEIRARNISPDGVKICPFDFPTSI